MGAVGGQHSCSLHCILGCAALDGTEISTQWKKMSAWRMVYRGRGWDDAAGWGFASHLPAVTHSRPMVESAVLSLLTHSEEK